MKIREMGLLLFYDWLQILKDLPAPDVVKIVFALSEYQQSGEDPAEKFDGAMRAVVSLMRDQLARSNQISQSRADSRTNQNGTNDNKQEQRLTTHTHTHTNTLIIPPISPLTEQKTALTKASGDVPSADVDVSEKRFDRFWEEYPNKTGKQAARTAWRKIKPSEKLTCQMIDKLREMKKTAQWTREGGRFVPNPATWLNQGRWEDEAPRDQAQAAPSGVSPRAATPKERYGNFNPADAMHAALKRTGLSMGMTEAEAEDYAVRNMSK